MSAVPLILLLLLCQDSQKISKDVRGFSRPVETYLPPGYGPHKSWGLIIALHGSGDEFVEKFDVGGIGKAGYILVFPASEGSWSDRDRGYIKGVLDTFTTEYKIHPDRIHLVGLESAGELICGGLGVAKDWDDHRIRSICVQAIGTVKGKVRKKRAKETAVWILNGTLDRAHYKLSKETSQGFKDAGFDVKYEMMPGKGDKLPTGKLLGWWKKLDGDVKDPERIRRIVERAEWHLKIEDWGDSYNTFLEARKAGGKSRQFKTRIDLGLARIEEVATMRLEEAAGAARREQRRMYRDIAWRFRGTPYADQANAAMKKLK